MKTLKCLIPQSMLWFFMVGLYFSCAAPNKTSKTNPSSASQYEEDLSALRRASLQGLESQDEAPGLEETRPDYSTEEVLEAKLDVTPQLNALLSESAELNKSVKTIPGYTVQVYLGTSREGADMAQRKVYELLPESRPSIKFVQPNYKVLVGKFVNRLEAQKTFSSLRSEFPNALVIPERLQINR